MDFVQANEALQACRQTGALKARLEGAGGLKGLLKRGLASPAARDVTGLFQESLNSRFGFLTENRGRIGMAFAKLTEAERDRLFQTVLPSLAPEVESAWRLLANRPYQDGLSRRPFRCPRSATQADVRGRWLIQVAGLLGDYDGDIVWVAEWAAYLAGWAGGSDIGWLLAGAIDAGGAKGEEVFEVLTASATGAHPTGRMGRHVIQALLSCSRPEAWDFVESLLLSAQRQEGLRQSILESVDEAHPQAFRRMLGLILREDLSRFSSVVRAADTWFGFMWDGSSAVRMNEILERVVRFLDDPDERRSGSEDPEAETVYLALWSEAFEDVDAAVETAGKQLESSAPEVRYVATHFLVQSLWTSALPPLLQALGDEDLRVAARALDGFVNDATGLVDGRLLFERLESLMGHTRKRIRQLEPLVWPWARPTLDRSRIAVAMAVNVEAVGVERFLPHAPALDADRRASVLRYLTGLPAPWKRGRVLDEGRPEITEAVRSALLEFLGDASPHVRSVAFEAMEREALRADEVDRLLQLLGRKPGDLRAACLGRLACLGDEDLLVAADRLVSDSDELRRVAGLELLRAAHEAGRVGEEVAERLARYREGGAPTTEVEMAHVEAVLGTSPKTASLEDAFGLLDPGGLPEGQPPRDLGLRTDTPAVRKVMETLAGLLLEHQDEEVVGPNGEPVLLLQSLPWGLDPRPRGSAPYEGRDEREARLPLRGVWKTWAQDPARVGDPDGLELLRALLDGRESPAWTSPAVKKVVGGGRWGAGRHFLETILAWSVVWAPPAGGMDFLLDGLEQALSSLTDADYLRLQRSAEEGAWVRWGPSVSDHEAALNRKLDRCDAWQIRAQWWRDLFPAAVDPGHAARLYHLLRYAKTRAGGFNQFQLDLRHVADAYESGEATMPEFIDLLVGRGSSCSWSGLLRAASTRAVPKELRAHPELVRTVERCRERLIQVEVQRGDRPTEASPLVMELRWTGGLETLSKALPALGKAKFARSTDWSGSGASRQSTLSHLVLRSTPRPEDSPEAFAEWARTARLKESRLLELAAYAPQWATHVSHFLGWPGLEDAAWWVQAHTKDDRSWQLAGLKELWAAEVSERTPLSAGDLLEGAVDVEWFWRAHDQLGAERWVALDKAAKYASSGAGHTRAQLFAGAMAGMVSKEELVGRIRSKRHKDSVRALGLVPLEAGPGRNQDVLGRYRILQDFRKESRKFGSQRQQSEGRAAEIGLANLARTAGFSDPQRLQWAMEREAVADLVSGPATWTAGDTVVELSIDPDGVPGLVAKKGGKLLKSIPGRLGKEADVAALKERLRELRGQASRVRSVLEEAMCRGDEFEPGELADLLAHPLLGPAIRRLLFLGDGSAGYPEQGGRALRDHRGTLHPVGTTETLRIAHPHNLFSGGDWSAWQRECFQAERVQPFKQVFREYYPLTETEQGGNRSRRYAGHQVNPRQALTLLGGRGWVMRPEEGVSRTFHRHDLTARLGFQEAFYTPADIEGLTLEEVVFTRIGTWEPVRLSLIPPPIFSEAMRDLDLVVSVAHQGGVDPEATASTLEMRGTLVREACELLGLDNVEVRSNHALVRGSLGSYSVHLGSAGVTLMPATAIPIVAVHSQHRGRLFLPFADDDPRTAEVLAKILLLARDEEIRDPSILERIRGGSA